MRHEQYISFPPFRLDLANERLWRDSSLIPLRPKTFAVLRYLVEHPNRLVTKEELLGAVWRGTYVSEAVPRIYVQELREVLEDNAASPRFIETIRGRGYRFITPLITATPVSNSQFSVQTSQARRVPNWQLPTDLVGRETELVQMHGWLDKALNGERQLVFVTGEPGIGKTALVEAFLVRLADEHELYIGRGHCIEHHGAGEAYLPVLEALGQLCRELAGTGLPALLNQYAPTWLVQMPWLIDAADRERLQREISGTTRDRMLREIAELLEALTVKTPLVLWLEDLHASDYSTLDLIAFLAQRKEPARLLLIGTYRPTDVSAGGHPLKVITQDLRVHRCSEELPLDFLTEEEVGQYLTVRFPGCQLPAALRRMIHQRTDGNPLFMVNVVDYLLARELMVQIEGRWKLQGEGEKTAVGVPESLQLMIERQLEGLSEEEQRVLEAASVVGREFSTAAVAAALGKGVEEVEERCEKLTRRGQFLWAIGISEWPDGTVAARYCFIHSLYHNVLYDRITTARRMRWHRQIGEREEVGYRHGAVEIAAELAMHFERGRDYHRAVQYLRQAGEKAIRQHACHEAIGHLGKGLELLKRLPDTPEHIQQELALQIALCGQLVATKGWGAVEVERVYSRARELCRQVGETPQLFPVLHGLCRFYSVRSELRTACELAEQLMTLARRVPDQPLLLEAYWIRGCIWFTLGDLPAAQADLEQGSALYDTTQHSAHSLLYGQDPGVSCKAFAAAAAWFLGLAEQALKRSEAAFALATKLSHPFTLVIALSWEAVIHQLRREAHAAQEKAEAVISLSAKEGFAFFLAWGTLLRGWALAEQGQGKEGIAQMHQGLTALRGTGAETFRSYFLTLLAQAYEREGLIAEGLGTLDEALTIMDKNGERLYEAELYRLKGELTFKKFGVRSSESGGPNTQPLTPSTQAEAETCFLKAIEIARRRSAKSLELRAAMSLARLWQSQGKKTEAHKLLAEVYGWFTEGFDTKDLQEAKALLAKLH